MEKWYFTFGFGQPHEGKYIMFPGSFAEARAKMIHSFGMHWAFQYSEEEFKGQVEKYNLYEVK